MLGQDGHLSKEIQELLVKELFAGYRLKLENLHVWELSEGDFVCSLKANISNSEGDAATQFVGNKEDDSCLVRTTEALTERL